MLEQLGSERRTLPTFKRAFAETARAAGLGQASGLQVREAQLQLLAARTRIGTKEVDVKEAEVTLLILISELA